MEWQNISGRQINMINEVIKNIYPFLDYPFIKKVNSSDEFTVKEKDLITFLYDFKYKINELYNLIIELEKIENDRSLYFQKKFKIEQKIEEEKEKCKAFIFDDFSKLTVEEIVEKCKVFDFNFYQQGSLLDIIKIRNKMQKFLDIFKEYEEKYDFLITRKEDIRKEIKKLLQNDLKFLQNFTVIFYKNDNYINNLFEKIKRNYNLYS